MIRIRLPLALFTLTLLFVCFQCPDKQGASEPAAAPTELAVGADRLNYLLPLIKDKAVALVVNQTSYVGRQHLADTLKSLGVNLVKIMSPEHGFRGTADAGEAVKDGRDAKLNVPIVSLHGKYRKPTAAHLSDVDVVVFDIQDVGVRFYTYISTLHYVMEACAENAKPIIVLDRPNPNPYVDGPTLKPEFQSFLGMHTIPLVHGMTIGEYAQMIKGEHWIDSADACSLKVVAMEGWTHKDSYSVPIKPSPNLPNDQAIRLYPSLGLFEGVNVSVGRGTQTPFQILGHPDLKDMPYQFTPVSIEGMSKNPPFEGKVCYGLDLQQVNTESRVNLSFLINMYKAFPNKDKFFNEGFNRHAGNAVLKEQIIAGLTEDQIRATWKDDLEKFESIRSKYLLYP